MATATAAPRAGDQSPSAPSPTRRELELYEDAVQLPRIHVDFFEDLFFELAQRPARLLREDFCGTARLCCEWAGRGAGHRAVGVDLDPVALAYARAVNLPALPSGARGRVALRRADVRTPDPLRADLAVACNFSFQVLHTEAQLLRYLRAAHAGLADDGLLVLEALAGWSRPRGATVRRRLTDRHGRRFDYRGVQGPIDRSTGRYRFQLDFRPAGGDWIDGAFVYDWRRWSVPALRKLLLRAGFRRVGLSPHARAAGARSWVTFVIASKK